MSARTFDLLGTRTRFGNVVVNRYDPMGNGMRFISVRLHGNEVALVDRLKGLVRLSTCGWVTPTTFKTINSTLSQLDASFRVGTKQGNVELRGDNGIQDFKDNEWYRYDGNREVAFYREVTLIES